jgi:hypothetical protein
MGFDIGADSSRLSRERGRQAVSETDWLGLTKGIPLSS